MMIIHHVGYVQIFDGDGTWILSRHFGIHFVDVFLDERSLLQTAKFFRPTQVDADWLRQCSAKASCKVYRHISTPPFGWPSRFWRCALNWNIAFFLDTYPTLWSWCGAVPPVQSFVFFFGKYSFTSWWAFFLNLGYLSKHLNLKKRLYAASAWQNNLYACLRPALVDSVIFLQRLNLVVDADGLPDFLLFFRRRM